MIDVTPGGAAAPDDALKGARTLHVTTVAVTAHCFLRSWFRYLVEHGACVTLATTLDEFEEELMATGAETLHIPMSRRIAPLGDLVSLVRLYRLMKRGGFASVHTHTSKAGFIGRLAAHLAGVPLVIHTMHEPPHNSARNPLLRQLYILLERLAATWAHHIVTVSHANRREMETRGIAPPEKISVLHEGLVVERYQSAGDGGALREKLGVPAGAPVIATVGRLEAAKGHRYLLEAAQAVVQAFPEVRFVICGRGRLRASLEEQASALGIRSHVIFAGYLDDVGDLLRIATVFAFPSLWEGLGIALLEAMAFRLPVVASAAGGIVDVVEDGVTGILVPPADAKALADGIAGLLRDEGRQRSMGEAGFARLCGHFRDEDYNAKLFALYVKLFKERGLS